MDLGAQKAKRTARMQAKKDVISSQTASSEAEAVAKTKATEEAK